MKKFFAIFVIVALASTLVVMLGGCKPKQETEVTVEPAPEPATTEVMTTETATTTETTTTDAVPPMMGTTETTTTQTTTEMSPAPTTK